MLDVKKLERRWLKYKIKKLLPFLVSSIIIILVSMGSFVWLNYTAPNEQEKTQEHNNTKTFKPSIPNATSSYEENATVLEPSMGFVQNFESTPQFDENHQPQVSITSKLPPKSSTPSSKILEMPGSQQPIKAPPPTTTKNVNKESALSINRNESKLDIDDLKIRFKDTSNANLGLFIARYYYDHGDFNEAYNYALKTNTLNSRIDESWIIFSKSLAKLGKTDQAKKTLQLYISQSNSESAKSLLDSLERGTFR